MSTRARRILQFILVCVTGIAAGVIIYAWAVLKLSVPQTEGTINLPELRQPVEITFDSMGIPQIWAETEYDGFFALGYQHAADRMFQMDMIRRLSQGRLSEILGEVTLETDKDQRRLGHNRIAQKALAKLSADNKLRLGAYADGVNAYRRECRSLPFEFKLLSAPFEEWTVYDCLTILSFQTWFSHALMSEDEFLLDLYHKVGPERARALIPVYPSWAPTTVPSEKAFTLTSQGDAGSPRSGISSNLIQRAVATGLLAGGHLPFGMTGASNAWVMAPDRGLSGNAMLASDPHLETDILPQFWYCAGLHIKETSTDVIGITSPGCPAVVMGYNRSAAWAFTAAGIDITEYYREKINPEKDNQYLGADGWRDFDRVTDTIRVSGADRPTLLEIRSTANGPVIADGLDSQSVYSVRWAGFDADLDTAFSSAFRLHTVSSFESFRRIVTHLGALDANWMYADSAGDIGYQLGTPIPIRPWGTSDFLLEGWKPENQWQGYYSLDEAPHAYNPRSGWLANCNNKPARYLSYDLPGKFFTNRILRITKLLESRDVFSVENMQQCQMDQVDQYLLRWKEEVARLLESVGDTARAASLRAWDGATGVDSRETSLLNVFLAELKKAIFADELGKLYPRVSTAWLDQVYHGRDSTWFDDITTKDVVETKAAIGERAVRKAITLAGNKTWGEAQTFRMRHPMATVPLLGRFLDLSYGPWPWSGTEGTLNSAFSNRTSDSTFQVAAGPSWRFVIDFGDIDGATVVLPAGNSGNPMSPHFFDFNEMWRKGGRWRVPISRSAVFAETASVLKLLPVPHNK